MSEKPTVGRVTFSPIPRWMQPSHPVFVDGLNLRLEQHALQTTAALSLLEQRIAALEEQAKPLVMTGSVSCGPPGVETGGPSQPPAPPQEPDYTCPACDRDVRSAACECGTIATVRAANARIRALEQERDVEKVRAALRAAAGPDAETRRRAWEAWRRVEAAAAKWAIGDYTAARPDPMTLADAAAIRAGLYPLPEEGGDA